MSVEAVRCAGRGGPSGRAELRCKSMPARPRATFARWASGSGAELRGRFSAAVGVVAHIVGVQPHVLDGESCTRSHRRVVVWGM